MHLEAYREDSKCWGAGSLIRGQSNQADVVLESGARGRAAVPSGASTGTREASSRVMATSAGTWARASEGRRAHQRREPSARRSERRPAVLDKKIIDLDGTPTRAPGANAVLGV